MPTRWLLASALPRRVRRHRLEHLHRQAFSLLPRPVPVAVEQLKPPEQLEPPELRPVVAVVVVVAVVAAA